MPTKLKHLKKTQDIFIASKDSILTQWVSYTSPKKILKLHNIDGKQFLNNYAGDVFDYFMGVISGELEIGDCPIIQKLLIYPADFKQTRN